jgi:hypothetical protein
MTQAAESRMQLLYKDQHPIKSLTIYYQVCFAFGVYNKSQNKLLDSSTEDIKLIYADGPYHPKLQVKLETDVPSEIIWQKVCC